MALLAGVVWADFILSDWQFRKALEGAEGVKVCQVKLDRAVYAGSRPDLADLRIVRGEQEVPYVLQTLAGSVEDHEVRAEITDKVVLPSGDVQFTLDLAGHAKHNRVRISTGERNFRQKVRVETSDDHTHWGVARDTAYIFDFSQDNRRFSVLTIDYPVSTRHYLRVTILGWKDAKALADAWVDDHREQPAHRETMVTVAPQVTQDAKTQSTLLVFDLGVQGLPHDRVRLETGDGWFHRAVDVETSADAMDWSYVASGVISRLPDEETTTLNFHEQHDRYLRLRIFNRDDKPIDVRRADLQALERWVLFSPSAAGPYWLYYGDPKAKQPSYDLPFVLARLTPETTQPVTAGAEVRNPAYRPPPEPVKPWSERHPEVLYVTLAVAVLGLGYVTVRFLLKLKTAG